MHFWSLIFTTNSSCPVLFSGAFECILSNCSSLDALTIRKCYFVSIPKLSFRGASLKLKSLYIYDMGASSSTVNEIRVLCQ